MEMAFFAVLAAITLGGGTLTIVWQSPLRSALSLLLALVGLAGLYVTLLGHFLAAMQVLVYAGAIMVLFVFAILLLDLSRLKRTEASVTALAMVSGLVVLFLFGKFAKVLMSVRPGIHTTGAPLPEDFGTVSAVGETLFRQFLMPFEMVSLLLLVAVVVAVVVARKRFWREQA